MDPPKNMDDETKKFLYDEDQEEIIRGNIDKNINASSRLTAITQSNE